jgi:hypothetical protein
MGRADVEHVRQCFRFRSDLAAELRGGKERGEVARRNCREGRDADTAVCVFWDRSKGAVHFDGAVPGSGSMRRLCCGAQWEDGEKEIPADRAWYWWVGGGNVGRGEMGRVTNEE